MEKVTGQKTREPEWHGLCNLTIDQCDARQAGLLTTAISGNGFENYLFREADQLERTTEIVSQTRTPWYSTELQDPGILQTLASSGTLYIKLEDSSLL